MSIVHHMEQHVGGIGSIGQIADWFLFLRPIRPAQLHPDAHLEHGVSEDRIPFRNLTIPLPFQGYGLGPVEHAQQRNPAPAVQMLGQITDQALYGLVLHHTEANVSGVLQSRGKEADATNRSAQELDVDWSKVMLTKFPR